MHLSVYSDPDVSLILLQPRPVRAVLAMRDPEEATL